MAVLNRQQLGGITPRAFTARVAPECYKEIEEWAWERRMTFAAAVTQLLTIALKSEISENGGIANVTQTESGTGTATYTQTGAT